MTEIDWVTERLGTFERSDDEQPPGSPVDRSSGILFAFVITTHGTGQYGRVAAFDRTGLMSVGVTSREKAREIIDGRLELWATDPYSDECWAYHNNDDTSPSVENTALVLEEPFVGEFTQRELFGGYTLDQFSGGASA